MNKKRQTSNGVKKIILASASPRRKEIFEKAGIPFSTEESGYEEDLSLKLEPEKLAKHLALCKAEAVARRHEDSLVIGADTIISLNGEVLGKPKDDQDAALMLKKLSGMAHTVITGVAIVDARSGRNRTRAEKTEVYFKKLTDAQIAEYVKTGEPRGKAGAYAIQGLGGAFIDKIDGDYWRHRASEAREPRFARFRAEEPETASVYNVMGLPLSAVLEELKLIGEE